MPVLVSWLALAALVLGLRRRGRELGEALVAALVVWSALLALGSELLSPAHALTRSGVVVYWAVVAAVAGLWAWRSPAVESATCAAPGSRAERALALGAAALVATVLLTTLLLPANTHDVMTYHLARVLHWVQGASLEPFPTHDSRQLYHPPFAELVDLHFLLLSGGDRWVGPLRVLFLVGAGLAAAQLAGRLAPEHPRAAAVGALVLAFSAPTTLPLVHGGKNDPVAGFFLLAMAQALLAACERPSGSAALGAGLALGLALLTKTTSFLFAAPFVALLSVALVLRHRRGALRTILALAVLPPLLMAGHMARNLSVYGHPLADPTRVEGLSIEHKGPASVLSNALRFSCGHFGGPWAAWNASLERGVRAAHAWFELDADDPRTTVLNQRFTVGNALRLNGQAGSPAHFLLALTALGLVVAVPALRRRRALLVYTLALSGAALLFCASLRWSDTVTRLQSPLFLLAAPLVAAALAGRGAWVSALYAFLLAAALPWSLMCSERPVLRMFGVLRQPRREVLYRGVDQGLWKTDEEAAAWIGSRSYRNVGVFPEGNVYAEYPLWLTLKDHVPGLRLEHVNVSGAPGLVASWPEYRDFVPDVVLWVVAHDLEERRPLEPRLTVGEREYTLAFQNERFGIYAR